MDDSDNASRDSASADDGANSYLDELTQYEKALDKLSQAERFNPSIKQTELVDLRKNYAHLISTLDEKRKELSTAESVDLTLYVAEGNAIFEKIHRTADATLDSRFLAASTEIGASKVGEIALGASPLTPRDYAALLKKLYSRNGNCFDPVKWRHVNCRIFAFWKGNALPDSLLASMSIEPKARQVKPSQTRKSHPHETGAPIVKHTNLADGSSESPQPLQSETTSNVVKVFQALSSVGPIPFYKFVIDPASFSKSIENIFYLSFLVNDSRARVSIDPASGELMVQGTLARALPLVIRHAKAGAHASTSEIAKKQCMVNLSFPKWSLLVAHYNLSRAIIQ